MIDPLGNLDTDSVTRLWDKGLVLQHPERMRIADEIVRLRAVLKPLLDHYLNCYDGNKDALALEAERASR